ADGGPVSNRPASAPASNRIAFAASTGGEWDIYTVEPDGSRLNAIEPPADDFDPTWSPDRSQIAFVTQASARSVNICVTNADGSHFKQLTTAGTNWDPAWSPDGTRIAYRN